MIAPWNAGWSGEERYDIRPCRWCDGALAMWQPHAPGEGRPIFAKPHFVRQRQSVVRMLCTVCGEHTPAGDRYWFGLGGYRDQWYMTTESPVHRACAELALVHCPHLKRNNCAGDLAPFPSGYSVLASLVGGPAVERDFGVTIAGRKVIGALKFAWPRDAIRVLRREAASA